MEHVLSGPEYPTTIPLLSLGRRLYETIRTFPSEKILYIEVETEERTTYKQFLSLCCCLAKSLQNCGYKLNDVIAVCMENSSLYYVPVVASIFLGMISTLLNQTYSERELSHMLEMCQPKIVFCSVKTLDSFAVQKEKFKCIERIIVVGNEEVGGYDNLEAFINRCCEENFCVDEFEPIDVDPFEQVAVIMCSSGTIGMPKGVMITHDNIAIRASQLIDPTLNVVEHEITPVAVPNFHVSGLMINIPYILKGNTILVMKRFEEKLFLQTIEKYKPNTLFIVPTIAYILLKGQLLQHHDVTSVEEIMCGSAPLSKEIEENIIKRFPNLRCFRQGYGLTESTYVVTLNPTGRRMAGSSGKIVPGHFLYIRDLRSGKSLGPNQQGEICVKGRLIAKGYYRNPEATKNTYVNGWLHTGDLGYYDENGFLFVVDRVKDLIKYKGFQVSPAEIESILVTHPKIKAASVVGKPDDLAGELPTAFVVKEGGCDITKEEIIMFVAAQVCKVKHLRGGVYFVEDLPKTTTGKLKRRTLRDALCKPSS